MCATQLLCGTEYQSKTKARQQGQAAGGQAVMQAVKVQRNPGIACTGMTRREAASLTDDGRIQIKQ